MFKYTIKQLPASERPAERLIAKGPSNLSDGELMALILHTGSKTVSAINLAHHVLKQYKLPELVQVSVEELMTIPGIGIIKAARIKAAVELANRLRDTKLWEYPVIEGPHHVAQIVMEEMRHLRKEHFRCFLLNTKNRVIRICDIHIGTANSSLVHPREVFREAVRSSATSCIFVHNHPSGDPTPSNEDISITQRLVKAGEIVGIEVLDHVVIGDNNYLSLRQKGIM